MKNLLLLGDEAIAQAALDAGLSGMYAYPGTPSTEIMEYIQSSKTASDRNVHREWSANEKTAMEAALGMSYCGKRAMVAMKHVGLNVAADPFINSAMTGVNGGLIVVSADDPSMHSSQNEQDSRFYGKFANVPCFEPSDQQEAYEMIFDAFELSEKYKLPVLFRITTRLAHSRASVTTCEQLPEKKLSLPSDPVQFVLLPSIARRKYKSLLESYEKLKYDIRITRYNIFRDGTKRDMGIIACGIAYNYLMENIRDSVKEFPVLKISAYPFPKDLVQDITGRCKSVLVLEEGAPMVEESLRGILDDGIKIYGRLDGTVPRDGELNPSLVARSLGMKTSYGRGIPSLVKNRPPSFCKGCGHSDVFNALIEALKSYSSGSVFSDIGCYTLGALPPYSSINSCVDMGASVTMAVGAADAGLFPSVCVIGDSTFTHSGMTGLLDAVVKRSSVTIIISDNSTTGMTGGQDSHATGRLVSICRGLGVDAGHIRELTPLRKNHEENVRILKKEFEFRGVSVIIAARECIQTATKRKRTESSNR
ncbi:MAG: indolepyruvate ferredoxin oxidoreductase [Bacteroidetes bacterium GWE2_41_25]|nr:MAG: indolepyruvate ferredoxin oxidoreductase [Bacteroidetes bacterium GWA2_40_15]OFX92476.1 MAG: indolepyruvate ferredoxin oxidoreductase [Bacteroidetes bacterium GWE2_41_25]OFY00541.1 MAG: indolepyruvate ferredoxin oxidoreductase [Bacteroidetes bacterium GWC2_40_22]HBH82498.1 indolepyruvate ferredoxin oxidoreductase [Bacteroidales bacterium]HBQ82611.1 indolepyruvate ferredoxin oxidoreductase [Bacteroidales bacterium]